MIPIVYPGLVRGLRCQTPLGPGTIAYVRMDHLNDIRRVAAVSVVLDARRDDPAYTGTIFKPDKIQAEVSS